MNKWLILSAYILLAACTKEPSRRPLIEPEQIASLINSGHACQIIDLRMGDEFEQGHIPGAVCLWRSDIEDTKNHLPGMRIGKKGLEQALSLRGLNSRDSIFIYDAKGNVDAARLWWLLQYYGFDKVALINGGFTRYRSLALPEKRGPAIIDHMGNFVFPDIGKEDLLAEKTNIVNGEYQQLIDCRSSDEYEGKVMKNGAIRAGHIKGSVHCDYYNFFASSDYLMKNAKQIKELLASKGLAPDKKTIIYCQSGVRSAFTTFALTEILGMQEVANYDGSWIEWSADENLPIEGPEE